MLCGAHHKLHILSLELQLRLCMTLKDFLSKKIARITEVLIMIAVIITIAIITIITLMAITIITTTAIIFINATPCKLSSNALKEESASESVSTASSRRACGLVAGEAAEAVRRRARVGLCVLPHRVTLTCISLRVMMRPSYLTLLTHHYISYLYIYDVFICNYICV